MALLPEKTWIGVLGGGQLGRMFTLVARRMGYRVAQWVGGPNSGPADLADWVIESPFDCRETLQAFLDRVDVVTVEFENIPSSLLQSVEAGNTLYPSALAIETAQHREREKLFLRENQIPCVPFSVITGAEELYRANLELPGDQRVLKTAEFGYDGKGQLPFAKSDDTAEIWQNFAADRAVLEQKVVLAGELSVLIARNVAGNTVTYDPVENIHTNHILDVSIVPARFSKSVLDRARDIALQVSERLDYVGLLAVEFFLTAEGQLLVNELAPRPHNSGHHTIDACFTSQFEQQLRAICDLPLGSTSLKCPVVMWNILGDIWPADSCPDWNIILNESGAVLHLYGKNEPRIGRKMGHVNFTGHNLDRLVERAERVSGKLSSAKR